MFILPHIEDRDEPSVCQIGRALRAATNVLHQALARSTRDFEVLSQNSQRHPSREDGIMGNRQLSNATDSVHALDLISANSAPRVHAPGDCLA
jgi:hypothetical protein